MSNSQKLMIFYSDWWSHIIFWYFENEFMGGGWGRLLFMLKQTSKSKNLIFGGKKCFRHDPPLKSSKWELKLFYWWFVMKMRSLSCTDPFHIILLAAPLWLHSSNSIFKLQSPRFFCQIIQFQVIKNLLKKSRIK